MLHLNLVLNHQLGSVISILCQQDRWIPQRLICLLNILLAEDGVDLSLFRFSFWGDCAAGCPFRPKILMKCAAAPALTMLSIITNCVDKLV